MVKQRFVFMYYAYEIKTKTKLLSSGNFVIKFLWVVLHYPQFIIRKQLKSRFFFFIKNMLNVIHLYFYELNQNHSRYNQKSNK